ncbi:MAG TPA: hypothetical protein GX690_00345 [Tenericutes bacterium]|jgi:hypothetical protein|nr:hypothetical protein [Mycoplasmatota bacterium]
MRPSIILEYPGGFAADLMSMRLFENATGKNAAIHLNYGLDFDLYDFFDEEVDLNMSDFIDRKE